MDIEANSLGSFKEAHFNMAGPGLPGDVQKGLLKDAIKNRPIGGRQMIHVGRRGEHNVDSRLFPEFLQPGKEGRNESQIVQHRWPQITGEPMHNIDRRLDKPLSHRDHFLKIFIVPEHLIFQDQQAELGAGEGLNNLILQANAQLRACSLLSHENLLREMPQLLLQPA